MKACGVGQRRKNSRAMGSTCLRCVWFSRTQTTRTFHSSGHSVSWIRPYGLTGGHQPCFMGRPYQRVTRNYTLSDDAETLEELPVVVNEG